MAGSPVAVVTGGARGIGKATCLALGAAGMRVVVGYHSRAAAAGEVVTQLSAMGTEAFAFGGDIGEPPMAEALMQAAEARWGRVDVLVNNAGVTRDGLLLRMKDDDWRAVLAADLDGAFFCLRAAAKRMVRQRSGRIINVASIAGLIGNRGQANYSAAKAGLIGLTRTAAAELAPRQITVNAVAPGWIDTDLSASVAPAARDAVLARVPLGRGGTTEEVAGVVRFLTSAEAAYITGAVIVVDGGLSMGG